MQEIRKTRNMFVQNLRWVFASLARGLGSGDLGFRFLAPDIDFGPWSPDSALKYGVSLTHARLCMRIRIHTYIHAWLKWLKPFKLKPAVAQL